MTIPAATPALTLRVDPNCAMETVRSARLRIVADTRAFLAEQQDATTWELSRLETDRSRRVVDGDDSQVVLPRPHHQLVDGVVMP